MKSLANLRVDDLIWLAAFAGAAILLGIGLYGLISLAIDSRTYVPTKGIVERVDRTRTYRHRKTRTESHAMVIYDTERFGKLSTTYDANFAIGLGKGDEVALIYDPEHPRDVRFPSRDRWAYGTCCSCGMLLGWGGMQLRRRKA